jgi:hypothetical protein
MQTASEVRARQSANYAFETLHALPCGCVAAVYRTQPWDVEVVALEARGPHCVYQQHAMGSVLGLGVPGSDRLSR